MSAPKEPLVAILWSAIIGGLGQIYAGKILRGIIIFCIPLIAAFALLNYAINSNTATPPIYVLLLLFLAYILFVIYSFVDAYFCAKAYNTAHKLERKITSPQRILLIIGIIIFLFVLSPTNIIADSFRSYFKQNFIQAFKIPTIAMSPTLQVGDRVFADKVIYKKSQPQRGDIIVFKSPEGTGKAFVKRVVGLPNDTVEIKNGAILINGVALNKLEVLGKNYYYNRGDFGKAGQSVKVPENSYFVLGDNSAVSSDSRFWGFVSANDIMGKVYKIYFPPKRSGPIKYVVAAAR